LVPVKMEVVSDAGVPREPEWIQPSPPTATSDPRQAEAVRRVVRAESASSWLRIGAIVLGLLWLATAVAAFATEWHQLGASDGGFGGGGTSTTWRLTTSLTLSGQASWGYAIAAAILFAASVLLSREQARDALDDLDATDEAD
jgi:hypothetical protein